MNPSFMHEAIRLSLEKMRAGCGGPFGAVIAKDGKIIGRGWNQVTTANDPAAHAEITAIREATRPDARLTLMPFGNSARPVPEGRSENSPAFQRWVGRGRCFKSRKGRQKNPFGHLPSVVPSGLALLGAKPSVETLGYFRMSLPGQAFQSDFRMAYRAIS